MTTVIISSDSIFPLFLLPTDPSYIEPDRYYPAQPERTEAAIDAIDVNYWTQEQLERKNRGLCQAQSGVGNTTHRGSEPVGSWQERDMMGRNRSVQQKEAGAEA